jgi:hypothetical protein
MVLVREVNAFTGSERFREKVAFSAQIAHRSRDRSQYFPRLGTACPPSSFFPIVVEVPRID